ncbi:MAG: 3-hydroxyacyl-CoA dehydrogenase family protein [Anaerolineae bacterium]|nr:3-hydroxyacyl-CoA dehydrogenase family protein [Anaerolineae bacterium]
MNLSIIGAGGIGRALAQVAVLAGNAVLLYDIDAATLQTAQLQIARGLEQSVNDGGVEFHKAAQARLLLSTAPTLEACAEADLVIDCSPEKLDVKKGVLGRLDQAADPKTLLAVQVETLSPSAIAAAATRHPQRVMGLHFFPPIESNPLVELIRIAQATPTLLDHLVDLLDQMDKKALLAPDQPGFLVNRLTDAYTAEALRMLDEGKLEAAALDRLMNTLGFPIGPFQLLDDLGLDTTLQAKLALYQGTDHEPRYRPSRTHRQRVQAGALGRKSGQGFYTYDD